jgi:hypothetical protein
LTAYGANFPERMGKMTKKNTTHELAQAYIDGALKAQENAGSPTHLSKEEYEAAVKRAESALRDVVPIAA